VSPGEQHSENPLDFALYAVIVHVGASIQMGHYVAYIEDPRGGWFKMEDHKASPVSLPEVLSIPARRDAGRSSDGSLFSAPREPG